MIKNTNKQSRTNQHQKEVYKNNPTFGIYIGEVVGNEDASSQGKIAVYIPALSKANPLRESANLTENNGFFTCTWGSPFAGSTQESVVDSDQPESYLASRKSYGIWTPPPDIGNVVLVCFGDGNMKYPFVISSIFPSMYTYMVPGMPAGVSYTDPNMFMPVTEKNTNDGTQGHVNATRPLHVDIAEAIVKQGLINDPLRGSGTSGSRRESPSQVLGILTPGPPDPKNNGNRLGGHQFVMDDSLDSRLIRLRTAGGNQLLLDDTTGVIYMINKKGTAWIELGADGDINFYGEGSMNFRTKGNFNLRADKNINIEAGQNVNIKAAGDNIAGNYVGLPGPFQFLGPRGTGGTINLESTSNINQLAGQNVLVTAGGGEINLNSAGQTTIQAGLTIALDAKRNLVLTAMNHAGLHGNESVSATSSGSADFRGSLLTLNSAAGAGAMARTGTTSSTAMTTSRRAPNIGTDGRSDAPEQPPEFYREAALRGETSSTTFGSRVGTINRIETIVPVLLTAEPYIGHASYDPSAAISRPRPTVADLSVFPVGINPTDLSRPADVNSPEGFLSGVGYTDSNGNRSDIGLVDSIPQYAQADVRNNFKQAASVKLLEIESLNSLVSGIQTAIPPIRFPTITAAGQTIIGVAKELTELEAQLRQFAVDSLGKAADLLNSAIVQMKTVIADITRSAVDVADAAKKLTAAGITMVADGASTIFKDKHGNLLVDFTNGLGPVGATLGLVADLQGSFDSIKPSITSPISQNQSMAIASFAQSIGEENFLSSNVLTAINKGNYSDVPRLMSGWVLSSNEPGGQQIRQTDLVDRRAWEASIFQTPDELDPGVTLGNNVAAGEMNFKQQALELDAKRQEYIQSLS